MGLPVRALKALTSGTKHLSSHWVKMPVFIQAVLLDRQYTGRVAMLRRRKQRGLAAWPMTRSLCLSVPVELLVTRTVSRSLQALNPLAALSSRLDDRVLSGRRRKNRPVSSVL